MLYRVILKPGFKPAKFDTYSEALAYQQENGGTIYQKVYSGG